MRKADYALGCALLGGAVDVSAERARPVRSSGFLLPSEIPGVTSPAWTRFADAARRERSADGQLVLRDPCTMDNSGFGMFGMRPRRLADLGLVSAPKQERDSSTGRMVWVVDFLPPLTTERFCTDFELQYRTFATSMRTYAAAIESQELEIPVDGMSLSGALAVLHRCGPSGLQTWGEGKRFERTMDFYDRANGVF